MRFRLTGNIKHCIAQISKFTAVRSISSQLWEIMDCTLFHSRVNFYLRAVQQWRQHPILGARTPPLYLSATRSKRSHTLGFKPHPPILGRQLFTIPSLHPLSDVIFGWPLIWAVDSYEELPFIGLNKLSTDYSTWSSRRKRISKRRWDC